MDIAHYYDTVSSYLINHPIIAGIIGICLAIFLIKNTLAAVKTLAFLFFVIGGFYFISQMGDASSHGVKSRDHGAHKSVEALEEK